MNILYLGTDRGTSRHRADALKRLGHDVTLVDPGAFLPKNKFLYKLDFETGGLLSQPHVAASVLARLGDARFDLVWVDNGRYVGPRLVQALQRRGAPVLNYNVDDPYGRRDRFSWLLYLRTVPFYDLVVVVRDENPAEARARGAKKVLRVYRSADEVAHAARPLNPADHAKWDSDVCFVGTWMPERGPFMETLVRRGVPLTLYGDHWQKAPEWPTLQAAWRGPGTKSNDDYAKAIQCARICLGLLSKGNRDLHTQRSLEVTYLGGLFCAERTAEHQSLYVEGEEAVFWSDAEECARVCKDLLADDVRRAEIARRGHERALRNGLTNEKVMAQVLADAFAVPAASRDEELGMNLA